MEFWDKYKKNLDTKGAHILKYDFIYILYPRGSGSRHLPLDKGGGGNRGWHGGVLPVDTAHGSVFLCQRWTRRLAPTGEAT